MSDLGNKQIMAENIQRLMDEHSILGASISTFGAVLCAECVQIK